MTRYKSKSRQKFGFIAAAAIPVSLCASIDAAIWHVDDDGPGGNGLNWLNAMNDLQVALGMAVAGDTIKVAQGTYKPGSAQTDSFDIPLKVVLEGGYIGWNAPDPELRNPALYETILSGDIDDNYLKSPAEDPGDIVGANSFHVLTIVDADPLPPGFVGTVVDGVTITAGNANGVFDSQRVGGGAFLAALLVFEPPFSDGPKFQDCIFVGNRSEDVGGALACADVGVEVRDCLILNNETLGGQFRLELGVVPISGGGGIAGVAPFVLVNSRIVGNKCFGDGGGGGIAAWHDFDVGEIVLASCLFAGNEALMDGEGLGGYGGGARIQGGEVTNCAFTANVAHLGDQQGGGFFSGGGLRADGAAAVYLSSFYGNDAPNGGGGGVAFTFLSTITNSIAWGNTDWNNPGDWRQQISGPANSPCPTWSNIQDWVCAVCVDCPLHNICADPYFVDPDGLDNVLGTKDDHLHLRLDSPSIDKGSDASMNVPRDSGDVDDDGNTAEELPWDLPGSRRIFDAGVADPPENANNIDQGAYEEQCPACPWDLDGDGTVVPAFGSGDLVILLAHWGERCQHANFLEPDTVGQEDLDAMIAHVGDCPDCQTGGSSGSSPQLEAATQLMGFAGSEAYGQWLRNEATDQLAEVSLMVLIALIED